MSKSKKIIWLSILQAWTMLWVVIGHSQLDAPASEGIDMAAHSVVGALFTFAYSFHMPLFIMISGYLFFKTRILKGWRYVDMVREKWLRLGIPYIVFISLAIVIKICFSGDMNRGVDTSPAGIIMNYIDPYNGALQEMWFVVVIFIYFLLYPIYRYLLKDKATTLVTAAVATAIFFIPTGLLPGILNINRALHFFIFFFIGLSIGRWHLEETINDWRVIAVCVAGYIAACCLGIPLLPALCASIGF